MTDLFIIKGQMEGASIQLHAGANFIGRSFDNDIQIKDKSVSRKHVKILIEKRLLFIEDLNSQNGTWLQGKAIDPGKEYEVEQGIPIALGDVVISLGKKYQEDRSSAQYAIEMVPCGAQGIEDPSFKEKRIHNRRQLEIVYEISTVLMQSLDIQEICEKIMSSLFIYLKRIDGGAVILKDPHTGDVRPIVEKSRNDDRVSFSQTIVHRVLREGKALMMPDTTSEAQENLSDSIERLAIKSIMCVPLISETEAKGVIYVHSTQVPNAFRKEDLLMLTSLCGPTALALENALLFSKTKEAEAALKKSHEVLEDQVAIRTAEIERANTFLCKEVSERKKVETRLRKSEERFRVLAELLPQTIFEMDTHGKLSFVNQKAFEQFGFTAEELDKGINALSYISPVDRARARDYVKRVLHGQSLGLTEFVALRKDGRAFPAIVHSSPIMRGKEPVGLRGFIIDISERKQVEEEKRRLEAQLYQAQKIEAIGTLAGGIAHNFNNLLMGIMGNVSLMLAETHTGNPQHIRIKNIEKLVANGSKLTRQLLGYARKGKYEVKSFDLKRVLRETAETFQVTKKEIRIHHDFAERGMGIKGDQNQIEQVLLNLLVNAGDAMPGGGDIFLKMRKVTHKDMGGKSYDPKPGDYVMVTLRDTGVGMDQKTQKKIFDPFFTTKDMSKGTGLGLASVYGIVKAHGGYIDVASERGRGTTFTVYLPASDGAIGDPVKADSLISEGSGTILLVDDEAVILEVGTAMLKELGYTVLSARSGREAVKILAEKAGALDLVILDMVMPDMGGGETFDKIKALAPRIKVLLLSGYGVEGEAEDILNRGCDGFIQKPFDMTQLSRKMKEIMESP